jgi:hypothetical protein
LERLIYFSRALTPEPAQALDSILAASIWNNARQRITGALGFTSLTYVQMLEGPTASLDALLSQLLDDPRHTDLTILSRVETDRRLVPGWTMARTDLAFLAPEVSQRLQRGDGEGLAMLLADLVEQGETCVA